MWSRFTARLSSSGDNEIFIKHGWFEPRKTVMERMLPGQWLNDDLIDAYGWLLNERDQLIRDRGMTAPRCHVYSCFFISQLLQGGYTFEKVRKWTNASSLLAYGQHQKMILEEKDLLFFPINTNNQHWTVVVVDLCNQKLLYYDTLNRGGRGGRATQVLKSIGRYLDDELVSRYDMTYIPAAQSWPHFYPEESRASGNRQRNACDCGVFVLAIIHCLSMGIPLDFEQHDMDGWRIKITYNLFRNMVHIET